MVVNTVPARGTRPPNRRLLTIAAAAELFHRRGYSAVSMSDIAAATNVGASAIYRHFPGKADLLVAAIHSGLDPYLERLEAAPEGIDLPGVMRVLAECALDHRALGVLWQRESRNLTEDQRRPLRDELVTISRLISMHIVAAQPRLTEQQANTLAWCVMGAVVSIAFHTATLPRDEFAGLLASIGFAIASVTFPQAQTAEQTEPAAPRPARSRREELITEATELFAERGYAAAGIDDIGDAVGIAGPGLYRHFASKQDILVAVVQRGTEELRVATDLVTAAEMPPERKLEALVDAYVTTINSNRFAIRILISEMSELPPADRDESRRTQRDYVTTWVGMLQRVSDVDDATARIVAQATLLVVNDAVQTPHLRARPGFESDITRIAKAVVGVPPRRWA